MPTISEIIQQIRESEAAQATEAQPSSALAVVPRAAPRQQKEEQIDALVDTIKQARTDIEACLARLQMASSDLRSVSRRNFDEASSNFLAFSNAQMRMAGAMTQALQRTTAMDRLLERAAKDRQEARVREEQFRKAQEARVQIRAHGKLVEQLQRPTEDDFDTLYGEMMTNAS